MKTYWLILVILTVLLESAPDTLAVNPPSGVRVLGSSLPDCLRRDTAILMNGLDPASGKLLFDVRNKAEDIYARNQSGIGGRIDTTAIPVGDSLTAFNATLVAPRLLVAAGHSFFEINSAAYFSDTGPLGYWKFVDANNQVHYAHGRASRMLTNSITGQPTDIRIFVLSNTVPVRPAFVAPENLSALIGTNKFPVLCGNQENHLYLRDARIYGGRTVNKYGLPAKMMFPEWYEPAIMGDSGCGTFVVSGNNLVWISQNYTYDYGYVGVIPGFRETCEWLCTNNGYSYIEPREMPR